MPSISELTRHAEEVQASRDTFYRTQAEIEGHTAAAAIGLGYEKTAYECARLAFHCAIQIGIPADRLVYTHSN